MNNNDRTIVFKDIRTSNKKGKRYATVKAIANGADSYNSIFTTNAREQIIKAIKSNFVKSEATHMNTVIENIKAFVNEVSSTANEHIVNQAKVIVGSLPEMEPNIGVVVDAQFTGENEIIATIQENTNLIERGGKYKDYLNFVWNNIGPDKELNGVSLVFDIKDSYLQRGKEYITDVDVHGLDFVTRQAHTDANVLATGIRSKLKKEEIGETNMADENAQNVDEIVKKAEEAAKAQVKEGIEAANKAAEEAKRKAEEQANMTELEKVKAELAEKDAKINELTASADEAASIADEAIKTAQQIADEKKKLQEEVVKIDNPYHSNAKDDKSLDDASLAQLLAMKDKCKN